MQCQMHITNGIIKLYRYARTHPNMMQQKVHVRVSLDGARYSRYSNFCLLSVAIIGEHYTLSSHGKCN